MKNNEDKLVAYIENFLDNDYNNLNVNLQKLLVNYKRKSSRLDKIIKQSDKQQQKLISLNEELDIYKNHLEDRVEEEIKKREEKEKMLLQQSKLAAMGEMMDAVAHQWKQPINIINMQVEMVEFDYEDGLIDDKYIKQFQENVLKQIEHMTSTLHEFRSFFRPNKLQKQFNIKNMLDKVLLLVKDEFMKHQIKIQINNINDFSIKGVENEFKHLVLNIINNAKDAFNENDIKNRQLIIDIIQDENYVYLEISDNAGGIPKEIIGDIFKANMTTKAEGKGTGIGLYMSSQIASKYHGELTVTNIDNGAKFTFKQKIGQQ